MAEYLDFELLLEKLNGDYRAKVIRSVLSEHPEKFFSLFELLTYGSPKEIGTSLHNAIFRGEIESCWQNSLNEAKKKAKGLRLLLRFPVRTPELTIFQWELLYSPNESRFIGLSSETPILRYLELSHGHPIKPLAVTLPLRVLIILSSPSDYPTLQIEQEWLALQQAMKPLQSKVVLERLEKPSIDALRARLRKNDVNILHFVGHGDFDYKKQEGKLYFENEDKKSSPISAEEFAVHLHDCHALRFVFLSACESASEGSATSFAGVAQKLVQAGIPAVLAMQSDIEDLVAIKFTSEFYESLSVGLPVEACVAEARKAIYKSSQDNPIWAIPVLFTHTTDGQLFSLTDRNLPSTPKVSFYDQSYLTLPPHYIERNQLLAVARRELLSSNTGLVVQGKGGIGKSILARALCNDPSVCSAFPDGVLWTTLGQQPDLKEKLREWIIVLNGIISETAPTLNTLTNYLAQLLRNRSCLLVLDDIWTVEDARNFKTDAPDCRMLITTRNASIAHHIDAHSLPIDGMSEDESLELLERWSGNEALHGVPDKAKKIVEKLGYLPLAIQLASNEVRFSGAEAWLQAFKDIRQYGPKDIFDRNIKSLPEDKCSLYFSLAIFREDEAIPFNGIMALWSALGIPNKYEAQNLLDELNQLSLIQINRYDNSITITIHDLLGEFIRMRLGEEGRLHAHSALITAYRKQQQSHGWHTVPTDGYFYSHLVYHLDVLAEHDPKSEAELVDLFATSDWLQARVNSSEQTYGGYISDLEIAWKRRHESALRLIDQGQVPDAIADCFRFAFIHSALAALSANYEPYMIAAAVRTGVWSQSLALSLTQLQPDHRERIRAAQALIDTNELSELSSQFAWKICVESSIAICTEWQTKYPFQRQTSSDGKSLEEDISFISKYLSAPSFTDLVNKTIKIALMHYSSPQDGRVHAFCVLAPLLDSTQADEALELVKEDSWRIDAITALLPRLTVKTQLVALRIIFDDVKNFGRREVLFKSIAYMNSELLSEMLTLVSTYQYQSEISNGLVQLAPFLKGDLFQRAVYIADTTLSRAKSGGMSVLYKDDPINNQYRNMVLFVFAAIARLHYFDKKFMSSDLITQKLGEYWQKWTFFLQYVTSENIHNLISTAIESSFWYQNMFDSLIVYYEYTHIPDDIFEYLLQHRRWDSLGAKLSKLTNKHLKILQETFLKVLRDEWYFELNQTDTVTSLISIYNGMVKREVVANLLERALSGSWIRFPILNGLVPFLSPEQFMRVFEKIKELDKFEENLPTLKEYFPNIDIASQQEYVSEILADLEKSSYPSHLDEKIGFIAPFLSDEQWRRAKACIESLDSISYKREQLLAVLFQNISKQTLRSDLAEFSSLKKGEQDYSFSKDRALLSLDSKEFYRRRLSFLATKLFFITPKCVEGHYEFRIMMRANKGIITAQEIVPIIFRCWYLFLRFELAQKIGWVLFFLLRPIIRTCMKDPIRDGLARLISSENEEEWRGMGRERFNRIQFLGSVASREVLLQLLEAIQKEPDEWRQHFYLSALAPCLRKTTRKDALEITDELTDLRARLGTRAHFLLAAPKDRLLAIQTRKDILEVLKTELKGKSVNEVLDFCSRDILLGDPILSKHICQRIGVHIQEILEEWKWN